MSLNVPQTLLHEAQQGDVKEADFINCIRDSLPYAWSVVSKLAQEAATTGYATDGTPPPDIHAQGELLRMMASDAMREHLERHFGVRIAFQNCCKVGVFGPDAQEQQYRSFVSARAQLLNQSPALINC